jgi:ankyrin repeat protein
VLFLACWYNHDEIVLDLIRSGSEVDAYDQRGWTPLMISVYHNHAKVVKILLDNGANPRHKDSVSSN